MTNRTIVLVVALCSVTLAQNIDLSGTATNASGGAPLQGVVVTLKNTPGPVDTTGADGTYHLYQTPTGVEHRSAQEMPSPGSRVKDGVLEISVAETEPVAVEAYGMNGVLMARLAHGMMASGHYEIDIRSCCASTNLVLLKVRQGDARTVYRVLPAGTSSANSTAFDKQSGGLSKSAVFADTIICTLSGFTVVKKAITAPTGVNDMVLEPLSQSQTVTDADGNVYHTVTIGTQVWMTENLRTTRYNDGTAIPLVTVGSAWSSLYSPAYCWYNNDQAANGNTYGAIYNGYAVTTGKLAPTGWHVPSDAEWGVLTAYLGGDAVAGGKLKETGTAHWMSPNTGATNESGFTATPGANREGNGAYLGLGSNGVWWCSTGTNCLYIPYNDRNVSRFWSAAAHGFSVRCVKD